MKANLIEMLLKFFICQIDTELFKTVRQSNGTCQWIHQSILYSSKKNSSSLIYSLHKAKKDIVPSPFPSLSGGPSAAHTQHSTVDYLLQKQHVLFMNRFWPWRTVVWSARWSEAQALQDFWRTKCKAYSYIADSKSWMSPHWREGFPECGLSLQTGPVRS